MITENKLQNLLLLGVLVGTQWLRAAQPAASPGATFNFNSGWLLFVGDPADAALTQSEDSAWKPVTAPNACNEDDAFKVAINKHPTGIAWYHKHCKLPPDAAGKKGFLERQGVGPGQPAFP